jgi:diguanylate cyclase (GGDEF)-like protein
LSTDEKTQIVNLNTLNIGGVKKKNIACVVIIAGSNIGQMYNIDTEKAVIGRGHTNKIVLIDEGISRSHCQITSLPQGDLLLEDLNSTNGTFVNSQKISRRLLIDGDKIQVGSSTILKFTFNDKVELDFQKKMFESALRDGLTKAYNKRYFMERIQSEYSYAYRHKFPVSLYILDLDHFKQFNDNYGHLCGDAVLVELAVRAHKGIRNEDVFARYGGEEFALITRGIPHNNSMILADRLRSAISDHPFIYNNLELQVTASIGVASLPHPEISSPIKLIECADKALYKAKDTGRNRVCSFN